MKQMMNVILLTNVLELHASGKDVMMLPVLVTQLVTIVIIALTAGIVMLILDIVKKIQITVQQNIKRF